jgi:hypothetical protein
MATPLAGLVEPMLSVYVVTGGVVVVLPPPPQDVKDRLNPIPSQAARFQLRFLMPILPFHLRVLPLGYMGEPDRDHTPVHGVLAWREREGLIQLAAKKKAAPGSEAVFFVRM